MATIDTLPVELDRELLATLQINPQAQKLGAQEFIQRAVRFYLGLYREMEIRQQYQKGYGEANLSELALEMKAWEDEQVWPEA